MREELTRPHFSGERWGFSFLLRFHVNSISKRLVSLMTRVYILASQLFILCSIMSCVTTNPNVNQQSPESLQPSETSCKWLLLIEDVYTRKGPGENFPTDGNYLSGWSFEIPQGFKCKSDTLWLPTAGSNRKYFKWVPKRSVIVFKTKSDLDRYKEQESKRIQEEELKELKQRQEAERQRTLDNLQRQAKQIPESDFVQKIAAYESLSELDPDNASYKELIQFYRDSLDRDRERRRKVEEEERERRRKAEEQKKKEAVKAWIAKINALPDSEHIKSLVKERKICIGMSADAVLLSWGQPDKKNSSIGSWGRHEQWIYNHGDYKADYLYFDNGILNSYQLEGR